jgi:hypothetical protein
MQVASGLRQLACSKCGNLALDLVTLCAGRPVCKGPEYQFRLVRSGRFAEEPGRLGPNPMFGGITL